MNMVDIMYGATEFTMFFLAFFYIIGIKPTVKHTLLYIGVTVIPTCLTLIWVPRIMSIAYLIASSLVLFYFFRRSVFSIISYCIVSISAIIADHFSQLATAILKSYMGAASIFITMVIYLLLFSLLVYLYKHVIYHQFHTLELPWFVEVSLVTILLGTIVVVYSNIFSVNARGSTDLLFINLLIQVGYFISILVLCYLLFIYLQKRIDLKYKEMERHQFMQYMKELELVNHDMHKFRHDYVNILLTMRGFLDDSNLEGLRNYFHEHIIKVEQQTLKHNLMFMQFKNIKIQELKGLIATKLITAEKNKIVVNVEVPDLITTIEMNMIDLARIVGVLLDNAIEESEQLESPRINFAIVHNVEGEIVMVIENRKGSEECNVHQIYEEHFSTKGKHRGIGLSTARKIVNQYSNVQLVTSIEQDWFIQTLKIRPAAIQTGLA